MFAYIDAGTAAAIAAMATGGMAGAKVAAQSFISGRRGKKKREAVAAQEVADQNTLDELDEELDEMADEIAEDSVEPLSAS